MRGAKGKKNRNITGAALIMTLLCLAMMSVIAMGLIGISLSQSRMSNNYCHDLQTMYVAKAGIERARAELGKDKTWGTDGSYSENISVDGVQGSFTVSAKLVSTNTKNTYKVWEITSRGVLGNSARTVTAVVDTESLARYVMFTNYSMWLWGQEKTPNSYDGPIHSNSYFGFYGKPEFDGPVTSSNLYDDYYDSSSRTYNQDGYVTSDSAKFYHYTYGYDEDKPVAAEDNNNFYFAGGQTVKPLPEDIDDQKNNATQVVSGDSVVEFLSSGNVKVTNSEGTNVFSCDNLTLYISGKVYVEGTIKGNVTLVGDSDVYITDNIVYDNKTVDSLALIAKKYLILKVDPSDVRDIEIDGMLFSLTRSFYVDQYYSGLPRGTLHVFGGLIQKYQGGIGTYNSTSGELKTGYAQDFVFDSRFLTHPPDNVPVSGKLRIKAWKDSGAFD